MADVIIYTASDVYKRLGISDSTLRKYMEVLQREGYTVKKNKRGRREYTENDIMVIEKLIELSQYDGMTLEKAAKLIMQQLENINQNTHTEEPQETDLIPYHIQRQYSVMANEMNRNLQEMEKRISERIEQRNERIEKRLEERDENLMKTLREIQETKRLMKEYHDEVAAAKEKKKPWWKFW